MMNPDVQRIVDACRKNKFTTGTHIRVNLSSPQGSTLGGILFKIYYYSKLCDLLDRSNRLGYPHNGGEHTLEYHGDSKTFGTWLEIVKEELSAPRYKLTRDEAQMLKELAGIQWARLK